VAGDAAGDVVAAGGERVPLSAVDVSLRVTGAAAVCPPAARAVLQTLLHDCRLLHELDADNKCEIIFPCHSCYIIFPCHSCYIIFHPHHYITLPRITCYNSFIC
jgi:hypothetical protein